MQDNTNGNKDIWNTHCGCLVASTLVKAVGRQGTLSAITEVSAI